MFEATEILKKLDVLTLLHGKAEVVNPEEFLYSRLSFCELMLAEVTDQISALQYTIGYMNALGHGVGATAIWVGRDGCGWQNPILTGVRLVTELVCKSLIDQGEETGELPLQPIAMGASYLLPDMLSSIKKAMLTAITDYESNVGLRKKVEKDLLSALSEMEKTGIINNLQRVVVYSAAQTLM